MIQSFVKKLNPFLVLIIVTYLVLTVITLNNCYFWDVIQQVSKEGYWFYKTNFSSLLIPEGNELNVFATGYHPPLMGIMTALLWKVFGHNIFVSHLFTAFWGIILIYGTWKLLSAFLPKKHVGWVALLLLLEPTVPSQFAIASPDFILFTALVISLRGIIERKPILLTVGTFFLCCVSMRGVFAGCMLFISNVFFYYIQEKTSFWKALKQTILPYLPTFFILSAYFIYYFIQHGWFFSDSPFSEHYFLPQSGRMIVRHVLSFFLRSIENGRIVVWVLAIYFAVFLYRRKEKLTNEEKMLGLFFLLMNGLYLLFGFISRMPFSSRYFMPQFFALTILVASFMVKHYALKRLKITVAVILLFSLTGHFWIYPEIIVKSWDGTLAHLPFYKLRKECFDYIDSHNLPYDELASDFCLYGDRGYTELENEGKVVKSNPNNCKYFIYSNISNVTDEFIYELKDTSKWNPIQSFGKWPVFITIYQNEHYQEQKE